MRRTYEGALKLLETRRRIARPKETPGVGETHHPLELSGVNGPPTIRGTPSLLGMKEWLQILGHSESDINSLNLIHVAGTKGKGSTCAFIRSFLREYGTRTGFPHKIGLYTSPDLRGIRERIQINDLPIQKEHFTKYFFDIWDRLSSNESDIAGEKGKMPRYLQFLALIAFHTFIMEGMDVTILETHHGGEYDATNFVQKPVVTAITPIGMDHVAQLGPTLEHIAWHKAGIFKKGAAAFSSLQDPKVETVLRARAAEKSVDLKIVGIDSSLTEDTKALEVPVQRQNCSLALKIADAFLTHIKPNQQEHLTSIDITEGIKNFSWPGRFEIIAEGKNQWFLDGAHNELSLTQSAEWFAKRAAQTNFNTPRILIFSHISEERDGVSLLKCLARSLENWAAMPDYVVFTTYLEREDGQVRMDKQLKSLPATLEDVPTIYSNLWKEINANTTIKTEDSIESAVNFAREIGEKKGGMQTFVTGSLHLVGGALNLLQPLE